MHFSALSKGMIGVCKASAVPPQPLIEHLKCRMFQTVIAVLA